MCSETTSLGAVFICLIYVLIYLFNCGLEILKIWITCEDSSQCVVFKTCLLGWCFYSFFIFYLSLFISMDWRDPKSQDVYFCCLFHYTLRIWRVLSMHKRWEMWRIWMKVWINLHNNVCPWRDHRVLVEASASPANTRALFPATLRSSHRLNSSWFFLSSTFRW